MAQATLRLLTCGSVDDGKSTLIGRLLAETGSLPEDELARIEAEGEPDYSLLLDGLSAEREQGITIDVAWRYFSFAGRRFIVADTPGHEQYTRNMVTGASSADLAILLVDAQKGLTVQTHRHAEIARMMGIRRFVLAVNKMDKAGFEEARFAEIDAGFACWLDQSGGGEVLAIPLAAKSGDNVVRCSESMGWYKGPTLAEHLAAVQLPVFAQAPLRLPIQSVIRSGTGRLYTGLIASGELRAGQKVRLAPSGRETRIASLLVAGTEREAAQAGQSVAVGFADQVDCARGSVVAAADSPVEIADQFEAALVWMGEEEMLPGRLYALKSGAASAEARITEIKHEIDVETGGPLPARTLSMNAIGSVNLSLDREIPFAPYEENRTLGGFILVDRYSGDTVGAGMIRFALRRAHNIHWQKISIDRAAHAAQKRQKPRLVWFTGLSGAGKSTIADLVEKKLHALGRHSFLLDGDNVRHGLNRDLGFTDADRVENIRRVAEVARLMTDAGLIILAAFISPFRDERRMVREMMQPGEFIEVHVDAPLAEAEKRDPKGLYAKARAGELFNMTGLDSPYEEPEAPEIRVDTMFETAEKAAERIVAAILA